MTAAPARPAELAAAIGPARPERPAGRAASTRARCELLTADDDSGMLAAAGTVDGTPRGRVLLRRHRDGRRDGRRTAARHIVDAYRRARVARAGAGRRALALRRRPAGRGRRCRCTRSARSSRAMTRASGKVPQISVVLGPAAGGAAYGPALTDVVILGPEGRVFVTGPDVVRSVTGEDVDMVRLGGPEPHGRRSGVVHVVADSEQRGARRGPAASPTLLGAPGHARRRPRSRTVDLGAAAARVEAKRAYDVHPLVDGAPRRGHRAGAARQVGAEHRHRRSAGSAAAPSA